MAEAETRSVLREAEPAPSTQGVTTRSVLAWNIGGYFWHQLPSIPLVQSQSIPLGRGFPGIPVKLNFFVLGFMFFTQLDVLFR